MTIQAITVDHADTDAGTTAPDETAEKIRGRDSNPMFLTLVLTWVVAGGAILIGALAGHAESTETTCQAAAESQVRTILLGSDPGPKPAACAGVSDTDFALMKGQILGQAFAG